MRRILPGAAIIIGGRMLFGSFLIGTASRENFFDYLSTPLAIALILGGAYFFFKDDE